MFLVLTVIVLFCWGWVKHVASGRLTTEQYVRKLCLDFQQEAGSRSEKIRQKMGRIAHNVRVWRGDSGMNSPEPDADGYLDAKP